MRMIVTPVTVSPFRMAWAIGDAPRYFGSSEAWTLIAPIVGAAITSGFKICP